MSRDGSELVKDWIRRCCGLQNECWTMEMVQYILSFKRLGCHPFSLLVRFSMFTMVGCGMVEMSKQTIKASQQGPPKKKSSVTGPRRGGHTGKVKVICNVHDCFIHIVCWYVDSSLDIATWVRRLLVWWRHWRWRVDLRSGHVGVLSRWLVLKWIGDHWNCVSLATTCPAAGRVEWRGLHGRWRWDRRRVRSKSRHGKDSSSCSRSRGRWEDTSPRIRRAVH